MIPHVLLAVAYVFLHSMLVLLQATTLNVAINASNKALLTIMMSNNFVELKGSVFKKFDRSNLFQVPSTQLIIVCWLMIYLCPMFNQGSCTGVLFRCARTVPPICPPFCSCSTNNERVRTTEKTENYSLRFSRYGWREDSFWTLAPDCLLVLGAEILVDWLKHAFITR